MNKKIAFTICAKNYIGLAQILENSLRRFNPDIDFFIFVSDELPIGELVSSNIIEAKSILNMTNEQWNSMAFKYDLTAFCTAIKPFCFQYLFSKNNKDVSVVYFDPDIYIYSSLNYIYDKLDDRYFIVLTPHINNIEENFSGDILEKGILYSGIYNLGFIAIKNTEDADVMLKWWANRLIDKCFANSLDAYFYDQKWIDFIPSFFPDRVFIARHYGLNVAPWNFFEREIILKENKFFVKSRNVSNNILDELVFVHYSGYDYNKLKKGISNQKNIANIKRYNDIDLILDEYGEIIKSNTLIFDKYIDLEYSYNFFKNGVKINNFQRQLYHGLLLNADNYLDPFSVDEKSFYSLLLKKGFIEKNCKAEKHVDKVKHYEISEYKTELKYINYISIIIFKLLGIRKYSALLRLMKHYSRYDAQIHLLKKKYISSNLL